MNEQIDIVNLLKDKTALIKYILGMIQSSDFDGHVADMMRDAARKPSRRCSMQN